MHLLKDAAFLHFRLKESSENTIYPWNGSIQKQTKLWSFLHFSCDKNSFFHAVLSEKEVSFPENMVFFPWMGDGGRITFPKKYMETGYFLFDMFHASLLKKIKDDPIPQKYA